MAESGEDLKREIERFLDENAALKERGSENLRLHRPRSTSTAT